MIQILEKGQASLSKVEFDALRADPSPLDDALWIDLLFPERAEEEFVEKHLGINIPSKDEMHEIEESSRLFETDGVLYMSCWLLSFESVIPLNTSVTFILTPKRLLSIRYSDHHPFRIFSSLRKRVHPRKFRAADDVFLEALDSIVGHVASTLRQVEQSLNTLSLEIFADQEEQRRNTKRTGGLKGVVQRLGKRNSLVSSLRESSVSFQNICPFLGGQASSWLQPEQMARLSTLTRDIESLRAYDAQLSAEINFLLDSTVGLISIQQNQSMKILSVAALLLAFI
jgi:magnesium transporter